MEPGILLSQERDPRWAAPQIGAGVRFNLVRGEQGPQAADVELVRVGFQSASAVPRDDAGGTT
jgi:hypothetical protein